MTPVRTSRSRTSPTNFHPINESHQREHSVATRDMEAEGMRFDEGQGVQSAWSPVIDSTSPLRNPQP